jgi:hypothetical protein
MRRNADPACPPGNHDADGLDFDTTIPDVIGAAHGAGWRTALNELRSAKAMMVKNTITGRLAATALCGLPALTLVGWGSKVSRGTTRPPVAARR